MAEDKLAKFVEGISSVYGEGSIFLPKYKPMKNIEWIPFGIHSIHNAFGNGIPLGVQIEIYGPESSGKTTFALECVKYAQKNTDKPVAFIDFEHALDPEYATAIGVNLDEMPISQPDTAEQGLGIILGMVTSGLFSIVVVDSVAAMIPQALLDGDPGAHHIGVHAKLMSENVKKITMHAKKTNTTVIWTNQIRHKVGVMFGSPETTPGGNALKFYASVRIDIRKKETITDRIGAVGIQSQIKFVKNKVSPPFKICIVNILFGKGFDLGCSIAEELEQSGRLVRRGAYYYLDQIKDYDSNKNKKEDGGLQIGQGAVQANEWLATNWETYDKITQKSPLKKGWYYENSRD